MTSIGNEISKNLVNFTLGLAQKLIFVTTIGEAANVS